MPDTPKTALLIGASRGLGLGLVREYLGLGWQVVATARRPDASPGLLALLEHHPEQLSVESCDVTDPGSIAALAQALAGRHADLLFIIAGASSYHAAPIHAAPPQAAAQEFLTNAYGPLAAAEALIPALRPDAPVVFMSSVLGSIANANGGMELYRATKAALNMGAVNFAHRHAGRRVVLMHPGWVKTDMGGAGAPLEIEESVKAMAATLGRLGVGEGVSYIDYEGRPIAW